MSRVPARPRAEPAARRVGLALLEDRDHYDVIVAKAIAGAKVSVWIGTANVKDLHVEAPVGTRARARGRYVSILELFGDLAARGVEVRLLHGGLPSGPFRAQLERQGRRLATFSARRCPRVHFKLVAVDGTFLYLGSANFTGAGLGAKGDGRRNFELGVVTEDDVLLDVAQARFERIWSGRECGACKIRGLCPAPLDVLAGALPPASPERSSPARRRARPPLPRKRGSKKGAA